jgi:thiamine-phosphate pyrophosphorylase
MIAGGASFIQLREKTAPSGEFYEAGVEVMRFARRSNVRIIINDRVDIALAVGAHGVHLGQTDLPPDRARKLLGPEAIIGFSTHTVEQAREARRYPVDYLALGPIFPTATKKDHEPIVGFEVLKEVRTIIEDFPLVAIGGVARNNMRQVLAAGADSVAVIRDILSEPELITGRIHELLNETNLSA